MCVSVKSHLASGASVCPENAVTYSAGNEGQNISLKLLRCRDRAVPPLGGGALSPITGYTAIARTGGQDDD